MDDRPRNLRAMLAEVKDTSELMVDLAYAALYFGDPDMAEEVDELEERMDDLVHDMRAVCVMAVRDPREADAMASVLQVISAIERIANAAVDIARIVTHRLGIPRELVADLSNAEEVSHRVRVREGSHLARRPLADLELPVQTGMRVMAIRRDREWITDVEGEEILLPGDVLFLRGSPGRHRPPAGAGGRAGVGAADAAGGRHAHRPRPGGRRAGRDEEHLRGRRGPGLLGAGAAGPRPGRRGPPPRGPARRDEGPARAVGAAGGADDIDPSPLRGLLHLSQAAEDIGDSAQQMVWLIEKHEERPPDPPDRARRDRRGGGAGAGRGRVAGRRGDAARSCSSTSIPGSTCWPCGGAGATSTGPGATWR